MFNRILVAVDLAEPELSLPAISQVAELAKASGAHVRLVHVRPYGMGASLEYLPENFFETEEKKALAGLRALAEPMGLPDNLVSVASPIGSVYHHILAGATEFNADLIVVGSHRPGMSTYLIGSNAARIVRHANSSVLVVRQP